MKRYNDLITAARAQVDEIYPWDLEQWLADERRPLLLDVREPAEYAAMHIQGSINVARGLLETACEYGFEETIPELVEARGRPVVVICRSGNRSLLAARTLQELGYRSAYSLQTGVRGWSEYDQPLVDATGRRVDEQQADAFFAPKLRPEQLRRVA